MSDDAAGNGEPKEELKDEAAPENSDGPGADAPPEEAAAEVRAGDDGPSTDGPTDDDPVGYDDPTLLPETIADPDAIPTNPEMLETDEAPPAVGFATPAGPGGLGVPAMAGLGAGALGLIGLLVVYFAVASPAQSRAEELEGELVTASARAEELEGEVDELTVKVENLQEDVDQLEGQNAELSTEAAIAEQALNAMRATQDELEERLKDQIKKGSVLVKERDGELVVDLIDRIVFDSGEAELNESGKAVLKEVGETLMKVPGKVIMVAGHTDNLPISDKLVERFPTNWELSTARSTNVVRFFQEETKIPGKRLAVAGFAEFQPIAKNRSKAGRRKNRRIEVRLLPMGRARR